MTAIVKGVDLDLLLEDLALTKRRVTELEDTQDLIINFLRSKHPGDAGKLKKLLKGYKEATPKKNANNSVFGQADDGLTTEQAIKNCFYAKPVSVDPISQVKPVFSKESSGISAGLRG